MELNLDREAVILLLAAIVDYLIGDPWHWPHPVKVMGWTIERFTNFIIARYRSKLARKIAGIILGIGTIGASALSGYIFVRSAMAIDPVLGMAIETILLASCFAGRSLRDAASDVLKPLKARELNLARAKLSRYVGRDPENLPESEILRAVLETVAENTTDGVSAPLFYAIIGSFLPGVGCVPLALAYKAASTLDSTIGYRQEPYTDLGWFSARLEDHLTWLPCRLTVLTIALLSLKPISVWQSCCRDGPKDPSPNSGWSECAYAAALEVQLGGDNTYNGILKHKPLLGEPKHPLSAEKIYRALQLTRYCFLIWLGIALTGHAILNLKF